MRSNATVGGRLTGLEPIHTLPVCGMCVRGMCSDSPTGMLLQAPAVSACVGTWCLPPAAGCSKPPSWSLARVTRVPSSSKRTQHLRMGRTSRRALGAHRLEVRACGRWCRDIRVGVGLSWLLTSPHVFRVPTCSCPADTLSCLQTVSIDKIMNSNANADALAKYRIISESLLAAKLPVVRGLDSLCGLAIATAPLARMCSCVHLRTRSSIVLAPRACVLVVWMLCRRFVSQQLQELAAMAPAMAPVMPWGPVIDGVALLDFPQQSLLAGTFNKVRRWRVPVVGCKCVVWVGGSLVEHQTRPCAGKLRGCAMLVVLSRCSIGMRRPG